MARQASLLVADEILFNLQGKAVLQGVYTGDLVITANPTPLAQLVFFFLAETDISDPFRSLSAQVTLPESAPVTTQVPIQWPAPFLPSERTKIFVKWPMLISGPSLRPGRINAKLIHENGEIAVGAPWIIQTPAPSPLSATLGLAV